MRRDYDALTGRECAELLVQLVLEQLLVDGRFSNSQCYHNVVLRGLLDIESYPHEPKVETKKVMAEVGKPVLGKRPKTEEIRFEKEYPVPDLAREVIEKPVEAQLPDGAQLLTRSEGKGP